jgi:hypothetical protein
MALIVLRPRVFCLAFLLCVGSCSKNSIPLAPVSGNVQHEGKGLAGVVVHFVPDPSKNKNGHIAQGYTGADGSFSLKTPPHGDGAAPGWYRVTVTGYGGKQSFPSRFTLPDKTPLVVEIPQGGKSDVVLKVD